MLGAQLVQAAYLGDRLESYARRAGFGRIEVLPIEDAFFRFYRLCE